MDEESDMNVLVCHNPDMERHFDPMTAFAEGLRARGHQVEEIYTTNFLAQDTTELDLVVIFGSGDIYRGYNTKLKATIIAVCEEMDIPFIMLEEAYVKRGQYWAVGIGGLARKGLYIHSGMDLNRVDKVMTYKPFTWSGEQILLCKQLERDANVGIPSVEYRHWLDDMGSRLGKLPYPVQVREHPRVLRSIPIEKALEDTRLLVTYSSTSAVDAALAGVPFYVEAEHAPLYELGLSKLEDIDGPLPDHDKQREILNNMANGQWTQDEMQSGVCWDHYEQVLEYWR